MATRDDCQGAAGIGRRSGAGLAPVYFLEVGDERLHGCGGVGQGPVPTPRRPRTCGPLPRAWRPGCRRWPYPAARRRRQPPWRSAVVSERNRRSASSASFNASSVRPSLEGGVAVSRRTPSKVGRVYYRSLLGAASGKQRPLRLAQAWARASRLRPAAVSVSEARVSTVSRSER